MTKKQSTIKKYYHLIITRENGTTFENPLTLSESKLFPQIIKENKSVVIELKETTTEQYNLMFK